MIMNNITDFCNGCCYRYSCKQELEKCCYLVQNNCIIEYYAFNEDEGV